MSLSRLFVLVTVIKDQGYLLEPAYEAFNEVSELLLGLLVVDPSFLVEASLLVIPVDDELIGEDLFIKKQLHERGCEFSKLSVVFSNKVQNESLHEVINSHFPFHFDELHEYSLIGVPVLYDVPLGREEAAEGDKV